MTVMDDFHAAVEHRRAAHREFRRVVEQLPPGAVDKAWDEDKLTVEMYEAAKRWRHHKGLEP